MSESLNRSLEIPELIGGIAAKTRHLQGPVRKSQFPCCNFESALEIARSNERTREVRGDPDVRWSPRVGNFQVPDGRASIAQIRPKHAQHGIESNRISARRKRTFGDRACFGQTAGARGSKGIADRRSRRLVDRMC